jgi:hypothetical protein
VTLPRLQRETLIKPPSYSNPSPETNADPKTALAVDPLKTAIRCPFGQGRPLVIDPTERLRNANAVISVPCSVVPWPARRRNFLGLFGEIRETKPTVAFRKEIADHELLWYLGVQ